MTTTSLPYPHGTLTKVIGKPTAGDIKILRKELIANARAIHSHRGGGGNGHARVLYNEADYNAKFTIPFDVPVHPGTNPTYPANPTQHQIMEGNRLHATAIADFSLYQRVKGDLKRMILDAVDDTYVNALEDDEMGYADVTPLRMVTHLQNNYSLIPQTDIKANRNKLSDAWDPTQEIEGLWTRIRKCKAFAANANEPLNNNEIIRLTLAMFERKNVYISYVDK